MLATDRVVREVRLLAFFIRHIWPVYRLFVRNSLTPRCRRCILPESYSPLEGGLCAYCREAKHTGPAVAKGDKREMARAFDELIQAQIARQDPAYHVMLLFSGGKDSCYMLHRLRQTYPTLRILAVTVDNTFMSPVAMENIRELIRRFDVDHLMLRPRAATMEKMFRYAITHLNAKGCAGTVDQFDGDFFSDLARNLAARLEIPYIFWGLSPTQLEQILGLDDFLTDPADEARSREEVAGIRLRDVFDEEEMHYWWNGPAWPADRRPQMVFPFQVWDLPETFIKKEVGRLGLMPRGDESPLMTNHQLIPLMGIVDMVQLGYSSFEPEFAAMVRRGQADRTYWLHLFETMEYAARSGRFLGKSIDAVLDRLSLQRADLGIKGGR